MDKYSKIKKIGEGSFGLALLVRCKENGKQMVVKEINMSRMGHKEREEARKETAVLAQLQHPNIVTYRESFEEVGNLYIVMDYCDGGDLYSRINQCRGILMNEDMILDWFVQICLSIKHIHDRKILHRDIKSQNIFMTRHGIIKLGDFGIAKVLNSTVELARTCIGTPYYLSPEIVENKPYNNKSDIWSLGCVLYEMTTLKHAFEAGNMKNLVLKIIRGSYPPVSPKYSYELRSLIAQLFKRNARDRPSINAVLRKPILQNRIKKFLSENEFFEEFSHTVMHGKKIQKALPPGLKHPIPVKANPVPAKRPPATPKYNPASVYGQPLARKSKEVAPKVRKSSEARRSSDAARRSAEVKRAAGYQPNSAQSELAKRKAELLAREKARREQARLREQQYARRQKELIDKQKQARMAKAREEGWKGLLDSDESISNKAHSPVREERKPIVPTPVPRPSVQAGAAGGGDRGQYEHYHAFLDKLDQDRKAAAYAPVPQLRPTPVEPPGAHGAGAAIVPTPVGGVAAALGGGAYGIGDAQRAAQHGQAAGARGADAAKKAKILEEYQQRRREAAMNKARGHGERAAQGAAGAAARPQSARDAPKHEVANPYEKRPVSAREAHRQAREQEYLSRLKQIRLQNFNERRMQNEQDEPVHKPPSGQDARQEHDVRKKKIEALRKPPSNIRAQADERAQRLKAELDRKRREAYDLEQQRLKAIAKAKAAPAIPMTDAMKAIGAAPKSPPIVVPAGEKAAVGMTTAMEAIGAAPSVAEAAKSPLQKKKEEILKRLNSKPQASKWGKPVEPIAERPKWTEAGESGDLSRLNLEETASRMEATSVNDSVVKYSSDKDQPLPSARRQWGGRAGTVLNLMEDADLMDAHEGRAPREGSTPTTPASPASPSGVCPLPTPAGATSKGATITLSKGPTSIAIRKSASAYSVPEIKLQDVPSSPKGEVSKLFDRVQLDDDAEDENKDQTDLVVEDLDGDEEESSSAAVKEGLCTGQFDIGDVKMLRTCSEPDLSKLFRTTIANNPFFDKPEDPRNASFNVIISDDDEEEDESVEDDDDEGEDGDEEDADGEDEVTDGPEEDSSNKETEDDQPEASEGSQSEDREGDDEDETSPCDDDEDDLETMRESMMSLLEDDEDEQPLTSGKKNKKVKKTKTKFKKKKGRSSKDVLASENKSSVPRSESVQDFMTMRETMRDVLKTITANAGKGKAGSGDGPEADSKEKHDAESTIVPGKESWQSDDEDDDYFEDDDDTFSRLEETRARLEQELGCETFLKAYKNLQAIHEDEDENMEEGFKLVKHILGEEKANLYPSILQLVMADGAFMEDNS